MGARAVEGGLEGGSVRALQREVACDVVASELIWVFYRGNDCVIIAFTLSLLLWRDMEKRYTRHVILGVARGMITRLLVYIL